MDMATIFRIASCESNQLSNEKLVVAGRVLYYQYTNINQTMEVV